MGKGILDPERGYLDKWQMHRALLGQDIGPCRLPQAKVSSLPGWQTLLAKYATVYAKPLDTWGGNGIHVVSRQADRFYTLKTLEQRWTGLTKRQVAGYLQPLFASHVYIVQQGAPLALCHERPFDIRALWQKDNEDWVFAGALARVGAKESIVSNVGTGHGEVRPATSVLEQVLPRRRRPLHVLDNIQVVGQKIANLLSDYRDFVEIGIDFGVAETGQLWLIEVNTDDALGGPSHALFNELPDKTLYQQIEQRAQRRNIQWILSVLKEYEDRSL